MEYTALHRLLGRPPGPIDDALLDEAITAGLEETDDLDWKREVPERKGLGNPDSEYLKDVVAFANGRGGVLVYGVNEKNRAARSRSHAGDWSEQLERSLTQIPASHAHPSVLGVKTYVLGTSGDRAVVVVVPASVERPHLIGTAETGFRAPVRNGADTVWMKERDLEAAYRDRFTERRNAAEALDRLYADTAAWARPAERAWGVAVAMPRVRVPDHARPSRAEAQQVIDSGYLHGYRMALQRKHSVFESRLLRPGLRRWFAGSHSNPDQPWMQASAHVYFSGAVCIAAALGGFIGVNNTEWAPHEIPAWRLETLVCDIFGFAKAASDHFGGNELDVRVGVAWNGPEPIQLTGPGGHMDKEDSVPLHKFAPVETTLNTGTDEGGVKEQARAFATDCVNQGGIEHVEAFTDLNDLYERA